MAEASTKTPASKKAAVKPEKFSAVDVKANVKEVATKKAAPAPVAGKAPTPHKPRENKALPTKIVISDEERYRMIAEAAYFRAESRQFKGDPVRDWIEAERDIATLLDEDR
jgi:hypothetical protein